MEWVQQLKDYFDPPQSGEVAFKHYVRTGDCNQCGSCCSGIYLIHGEKPIDNVETFHRLKAQHTDYQHFIPVDETEIGVQFKCRHLSEDNACGIYHDRPMFCKKYPTEATIIFGGKLAPNCGFAFKPKTPFSETLSQIAAQKNLKPGKLLNDPIPESQAQ